MPFGRDSAGVLGHRYDLYSTAALHQEGAARRSLTAARCWTLPAPYPSKQADYLDSQAGYRVINRETKTTNYRAPDYELSSSPARNAGVFRAQIR